MYVHANCVSDTGLKLICTYFYTLECEKLASSFYISEEVHMLVGSFRIKTLKTNTYASSIN
jgi:hypothetical protein